VAVYPAESDRWWHLAGRGGPAEQQWQRQWRQQCSSRCTHPNAARQKEEQGTMAGSAVAAETEQVNCTQAGRESQAEEACSEEVKVAVEVRWSQCIPRVSTEEARRQRQNAVAADGKSHVVQSGMLRQARERSAAAAVRSSARSTLPCGRCSATQQCCPGNLR